MENVGTLTNYVGMLCNDLRNASSGQEHPLHAERVGSAGNCEVFAALVQPLINRHGVTVAKDGR